MDRVSKLVLLFCGVLSLISGVENAPKRSQRDNKSQRNGQHEENMVDIKTTLLELESKLNTKVQSIEHKLSWKINDKIRKINHTVEIAHLERLFHLVNEELTIGQEKEETQKLVVENLQRVISQQNNEVSNLRTKIQHLEDIVLNITNRIELPNDIGIIPDDPNDQLSNHIKPPTFNSDFPQDCMQAYEDGRVTSHGTHFTQIQPWFSTNAFEVRCQIKRDLGWTVIQRRVDGSVNFFRGWREYRNGFGTFRGEFWLGLQRIHEITTQGDYKLRIEMTDWEGNDYWAEYEHFRVGNEASRYRLHVHGYHGNAGDSLTSRWENHNGQPFSTYDNDNDGRFYDNCARHYQGAWWFTSCFESHLNGKYYHKGEHNDYFQTNGIQWNTIHVHSSLQVVEMMVLPYKHYQEPTSVNELDTEQLLNELNQIE